MSEKDKPFIVFGRPAIEREEIDEVVDSLEDGWIGTGPKVARFEQEFREFVESPYSCALSSCTAGLHLALLALDLEPGSEVITTPMTFCATVNAIIHAGLTPVLADVDKSTGNIDPESVVEKITERSRALVPVHLAGLACDMTRLMDISSSHKLRVVEDCAHAVESTFEGKQAGTLGDLGVFSFYATKNVVTGEGGMVISENQELVEKIKSASLHGMTADAWGRFSDSGYKHYRVTSAGFKCNMMDLQAAIGIHQLRRVMKNWERRKKVWEFFHSELLDLPLDLPARGAEKNRHAFHLFAPRLQDGAGITRDEFLNQMTHDGIGVGVHYLSIPEHPFYRERYGWTPDDFPNAAKIGRRTFSLPLSPSLTDSDVERIVSAVKRALK